MEVAMKKIEKILVPTDFSEGAKAAYSYAQKIASMFGAKIDFIHIIPLAKYFSESIKKMGVPFDMDKDLYPHVVEEAEHQMANIMNDYVREENRGESFVKIDRKPSEAIVDHAQSKKYDLILMGAKGSHETDLLQGATTEKVIRYSDRPVLSVPSDYPAKGVDHILMPTDISDLSLEALAITIAMANALDAEITFFHVIELYGSLSESIPHVPGQSEMESIYDRLVEKVDKHLSEASDVFSFERTDETYEDYIVLRDEPNVKRIPVHTLIEKGISAHYEIEDYAMEHADLIVMATHGHTGLAHFFLGSTTEKVSQHVNIPTLTIRPDQEKLKPAKSKH